MAVPPGAKLKMPEWESNRTARVVNALYQLTLPEIMDSIRRISTVPGKREGIYRLMRFRKRK
ncbi:MAG: hypothetical protein ACE5D4_09305 [Thermodesulfobacteriota bacterium]